MFESITDFECLNNFTFEDTCLTGCRHVYWYIFNI